MYVGVVKGQGGVLGVILLRAGAFPIGRARSDQQLASSETHARAPAGCVLDSDGLFRLHGGSGRHLFNDFN